MLGPTGGGVNGFLAIAPVFGFGHDGAGSGGESKMKRGIMAMAGVAMVAAACTHVDDAALSRLRAGKTTAAETIQALGRPDRDETLPDGSRMLTYLCSETVTTPANFVPGLVYVWGGWHATTDEAGLMFGPDGILRFYSWSSHQQTPIKVVGHDIVPSASRPMTPEMPRQDLAPVPWEAPPPGQPAD